MSESDVPCGVSDCDSEAGTSVPVVPVVLVVPVSPSSVVTEVCDGFSLDSDWEFVEPQSFSFSQKRSSVLEENPGEMGYEGSPVKAPPPSRRRIIPPTPKGGSDSSVEETQWQIEVDQIWNSHGRTVIAKMAQYFEKVTA